MVKTLTDEDETDRGAWLSAFWKGEWGRGEPQGEGPRGPADL